MSKSKRTGNISELEFLLNASKKGLSVSKPYGDDERYDFIVEFNGKMKRVQVKSVNSTSNSSKSSQVYNVTFNGKCYKKDVEILAIYLIDKNVWYVIPAKKVTANYAIELNPTYNSKYNKYIDAWELLKK